MNVITTERIRDTCVQALQQGATSIDLRLSSEGGLNTYSFTLYNFLRSLAVPLTVPNMGTVESMAIPVL